MLKRPFIDYLVDTRDDDWYNFTWCEDHSPPDFTPDANCEQFWAEPIAQCMETCDNGVRSNGSIITWINLNEYLV